MWIGLSYHSCILVLGWSDSNISLKSSVICMDHKACIILAHLRSPSSSWHPSCMLFGLFWLHATPPQQHILYLTHSSFVLTDHSHFYTALLNCVKSNLNKGFFVINFLQDSLSLALPEQFSDKGHWALHSGSFSLSPLLICCLVWKSRAHICLKVLMAACPKLRQISEWWGFTYSNGMIIMMT